MNLYQSIVYTKSNIRNKDTDKHAKTEKYLTILIFAYKIKLYYNKAYSED